MERGTRNLIPPKFEKLGLLRFILMPLEFRVDKKTTTATSPESFSEAKAVKATLEAKRAEAMCQARRVF